MGQYKGAAMSGRAEWRMEFWDEIRWRAKQGKPFSSDDVIEAIGHLDQFHMPNGANNMVGQMFRQAHTDGLIEPVGFTKSRQPTRHGGMVRLWRGTGAR
jgi:hypothetical protein